MKKSLPLIILGCSWLLFANIASAASGSKVPLLESYNNLNDVESLRRGAVLYANNCSSCHSMKYLRYNTIAEHLNWSDEEINQALMKNKAKIHDFMLGGLDDEIAKEAYGNPIPDLTLVAKSRSPNWIYTYLKAYYSKDSGHSNNYLFPDVAMPNVLGNHQGEHRPVAKTINGKEVIVGTRPYPKFKTQAEKLVLEEKEKEFNQTVRDIVNFLEFASEPNKLERHQLGIKVILFLIVLLIAFVLLKKDYWRDVKSESWKKDFTPHH